LAGAAVFVWTEGRDVNRYRLSVGSAVGGTDLYDQQTDRIFALVTGLPQDGRTLYVRLWSRTQQGSWLYHDYTYRAARLGHDHDHDHDGGHGDDGDGDDGHDGGRDGGRY
jgi:hypothetical protein